MENSHLVQIIGTLSKKEVRELRKWLQSPFHNQRDDVTALFDYLTMGNHLKDPKFLVKERVFRKIFPNTPYDDARIRQTMHFLMKCMEAYFTYQSLQENEILSTLSLARLYRHRNLEKPYQRTLKGLEKAMETYPYRDEEYQQFHYLLELERYRYLSEKQRTATINLQSVSDDLEAGFIIGKLRVACFMLAHQKVYKTEYDLGMMPQLLDYVASGRHLDQPAVRTYYYAYLSIIEPEEESHFFEFKKAIFNYHDSFPQSDNRDLILLALNYCIAKINIGERKFFKEAFDLYEQGMASEAFIENGVLDHRTFRNAISAAITIKKFAWVEEFIEAYQSYLPDEHRESFVKLSLAQLYYAQQKFDHAQRMLVQITADDLLVNLNAKWMLIRIYYQEGEYQLLESLLDSMKTYINRKKVLGYHKNSYTNLIRFTRRLMRINPYDKTQKEKLRTEIQSANPLIAKNWFLQQLEQL